MLRPVLLRPDQFDAGSMAPLGKEILQPQAEDMLQKWPVSQWINSPCAPKDDPTLIEL